MKRIFFLLIFLFSIIIYADNGTAGNKLDGINRNFFIENRGQWPSEVKYLAKVGGMNAWITNSGVVYDYYKINRNYTQQKLEKLTPDKKTKFEQDNTSIKGHVVKMQLVSVNENAVCTGNNRQEGYYNYFLGKDQTKWAGNVPLYGNVAINEIYPNIDVKYYFDGKNIRYDYIVKPGADISKLRMKFEGQEAVRVNESGELVIKTSLGEVTNGKLYSYQNNNDKQQEIACNFEKNQDGSISLNVNNYDKTKDLIIDPLIYSTFLGGDNEDRDYSITIDSSGNAYVSGSTFSSNFPITPGAYQTTKSIGKNIFVAKLNSTGNALIYSTFIGGSDWNEGYSITFDTYENVYLTGYTQSAIYPTTPGAYQPAFGGGYKDGFITKLNPTGSALVYSSYIGGSDEEYGTSISIDANCNAYITGYTLSTNYPTTPGAFQTTFGGEKDGFVTKMNTSGSALIYSTFIGGSSEDYVESIKTDINGNAYITGQTRSINYPTTPGTYRPTFIGSQCNFITKVNPSGTTLVYSTFIGEGSGLSIAIDTNGNAYITGETWSANYPTTPGAFQTTFRGGVNCTDAFVTKLNSAGNAMVYSTFTGGNGSENGSSIAIDAFGNAYITGSTNSSNFPITPGAFQTFHYGTFDSDVFMTKLNAAGNALVYSTYIGAMNNDYAVSISTNNRGDVCITGNASANYPTTPGAFQTVYDGGSEIFITKFNLSNLQLTLPNGGEKWVIGSSQDIRWASSISSNIKIEYSTNNGSDWTTIADSLPSSTQAYSWVIPNTLSTHCKVRITALDNSGLSDVSDSTFTISQNTGVNDNSLVPLSNSLSQNYPNPFNPQTTISYSVAKESNVVIRVYDILGKEVAKLLNEDKKAGAYNIQFNASKLSSGMYFYTIQATSLDGKQSFRETKKMLLLK